MSKKIAVLVGSLRKESYSRKIADELIRLQPDNLNLNIVEIGNLPFYNEDLENENPPQQWTDFRNTIRISEGVIFVTPEYNRSVPAVLKNAVDVGSRPKGEGVLNGKPAGVISVSPGGLGAFGASHHLRQSLVPLNMSVMQQPETYIGNVGKLFSEDGKTVVEATETVLQKFLTRFESWILKIS